MADTGKGKTFHLEKLVNGTKSIWQIQVKGTKTLLKVSEAKGFTNQEAVDHGSIIKAKKFAEKQTNIMLKKGYKYKQRKHKILFDDADVEMATEPDAIEDDAMSLASSTSTLDVQDSSTETSGISPLNRKRFLEGEILTDPFDPPIFMRPSLKSDVTMVSAVPGAWADWRRSETMKRSLTRDDTLINTSSVKRIRSTPGEVLLLKVPTKWGKWRKNDKNRETDRNSPSEDVRNVRLRRKRTLEADHSSFSLLKKQSTTRELRQHLEQVNVHSQPREEMTSRPLTRLQRKLSGASLEQLPGMMLKQQSSTFGLRCQLNDVKLTRKPTLVDSPKKTKRTKTLHTINEEEGTGNQGLDETDSTLHVNASQPDTDTRDECDGTENNHNRRQNMKRVKSRAVGGQDSMQPTSKRARRVSTLTPHSSEPFMFMPDEDSWPVVMGENLLLTCSLKDTVPGCKYCSAVLAEDLKCYIGTNTGSVLELNSGGKVLRLNDLPRRALSIGRDGEFLYVACSDGTVYDISGDRPRQICSFADLGQVRVAEVLRHQVVLCDDVGHMTLNNIRGSTVWKVKDQDRIIRMIRLDESGVYAGHSDGIAKYSLMDGTVIWNLSLQTSFHAAALSSDALYVATGAEILKIDKITGKVLKDFHADENNEEIQILAVGGGAVFSGAGNNIIVFDEKSGKVIYTWSLQHDTSVLQYISEKVYTIGDGGFAVYGLSQQTVEKVMRGGSITPTVIKTTCDVPHVGPSSTVTDHIVTPGGQKSKLRKGKLRAKGASK